MKFKNLMISEIFIIRIKGETVYGQNLKLYNQTKRNLAFIAIVQGIKMSNSIQSFKI